MLLHFGDDLILRLGALLALLSPVSSRVQRIPCGTLPIVAALPRVVIPESVHDHIPDRPEPVDEHSFGEWNPDVVGDEVAALEVRELEVLRLRDGTRVLSDTAEQDGASRRETETPFASAQWYCLSHVVEWDKPSCATLRRNRGIEAPHRWPIFETDVREFDYKPYAGSVDLLGAGVPCQPFSLGGQHRGRADERNMFPALLDAVRALWPKAILVENVRGLIRPGFLPYFDYVMDELRFPTLRRRHGETWRCHCDRLEAQRKRTPESSSATTYRVVYKLIECADYGVPQTRKRIIAIALRGDIAAGWQWPETSHSQDALLYAQWVDESYWKRHKLNPRPVPATIRPRVDALRQLWQPGIKPWHTVRDALAGLPEPVNGVPHRSILNHTGIPGARVYPGHSGSDRDWPAKTLKAGVHGVPGGEATVLLEGGRVRYFSIRESARIQTFPDDYEFVGVRSEAMRQIGNAVPAAVATVFGEAIARALRA